MSELSKLTPASVSLTLNVIANVKLVNLMLTVLLTIITVTSSHTCWLFSVIISTAICPVESPRPGHLLTFK